METVVKKNHLVLLLLFILAIVIFIFPFDLRSDEEKMFDYYFHNEEARMEVLKKCDHLSFSEREGLCRVVTEIQMKMEYF